MNNKSYSDWNTTEYPENSGNYYIYNPYTMGQGSWAVLTKNNKSGKVVQSALQSELNKFFFGRSEIPSLYERFMKASVSERSKLENIAMTWLTLKIKHIKGQYTEETFPQKNRRFIEGGMYFYIYDAKYKNKLPMWDKFPLIILLQVYGDGFLGLNLHYLPTKERLVFLGKLLTMSNKSDPLLVNISYDYLNGSQRFKEFRPCVKKYLTSHIVSRILPIESHEWVYAAGLNIQQFQYKK